MAKDRRGPDPLRVSADEQGFAHAIFERSGLLKLRAEELEAREVDDLCDRCNGTAV